MKQNIVPNHAVLHHAIIAREIGGYEFHAAARSFCDWDFWMRCAQKYPFVHIPAVLSRVAYSDASTGVSSSINAARALCSIDRTARLQLSQFGRQGIDEMKFVYRYLKPGLAEMIYNQGTFTIDRGRTAEASSLRGSVLLPAFRVICLSYWHIVMLQRKLPSIISDRCRSRGYCQLCTTRSR